MSSKSFIANTKDPLETRQNLIEASNKVQNVHKARVEINRLGFKTSRNFYFRLSLLSAGTISLSVTFVGFLASTASIIYMPLLISGWVLLFICTIASIYRNYYHSNFLHWQVQKMYAESKSDEAQNIIDGITTQPMLFYNIDSEKDKNDLIEIYNKNLSKYKSAMDKAEKREKMDNFSWIWLQRIANISFIVGLFFVVLFASFNVLLLN